MRILFLTPTLAVGGSEKLTLGYALGLQGRGHEVGVAYGVREDLGPPLADAGIPLFKLTERKLEPSTFSEWTRRLHRVFREFRPDVVHAQSVSSALIARIAAPRMPILVTMHGILHSDEALAGLGLRLVHSKVTCVSEATAAGLARYFWAPSTELLNPGVNVDQLRADSTAKGPIELIGEPRLCCVARLEHQKGIDILLQSLAVVAREVPTVGLTVVGEGSELDGYVALAARLGITDRVHFTGSIPNAAPYIAAADIMVLPSRWEGLPVVVLESLALERPLIATAVNGTPTVVVDGKTGWLVPPEDPEALAAAIVDCVRRPDDAARRAQAGRELIEARFSTRRMIDRLEGFLAELVGPHAVAGLAREPEHSRG